MSWFDSAKATITRVHQEQLKLGVTDRVEILKAVDNAYPFGERAMFPYKAWLKARKEFIAHNGGVKVVLKPDDLFYECSD